MAVQPSECSGLKLLELDDLGNDDDILAYSTESGGSVNVSCLSRYPHEWISTAEGFDPVNQIRWYGNLTEMDYAGMTRQVLEQREAQS